MLVVSRKSDAVCDMICDIILMISGSQVTWIKGNTQVKQSRFFQIKAEKDLYSLTITEAFPEDEGVYRCTASTPAGSASTEANLHVIRE